MEERIAVGTTTISGGLHTSSVRAYQWLEARGEMPVRYGYGVMSTFGIPGADRQFESLHQRAQSVGLDSTFVLVSNSGHGWRPLGGPIVPSQEEIHRITADFIRKHTSRRTD